MAWRPYDQLIEGELDNTVRGKVTGWMRFIGLNEKITFDLNGDFHRDIRGAKVRLIGNNCATRKSPPRIWKDYQWFKKAMSAI